MRGTPVPISRERSESGLLLELTWLRREGVRVDGFEHLNFPGLFDVSTEEKLIGILIKI